MVSFEPQNSFEHIDKLAYEIGPRLAGSERSQRTAEYIKQDFDEHGLKARFQNFWFVNKIARARAMAMILGGVFIAALFLNLYLSSWIAFAVVIGAYAVAYSLKWLMPKKKESNVVATLKPEGKVKRRIVLGAHYDTARCTKSRRWTIFFRAAFPVVLIAFLVLSFLGLFVENFFWFLGWIALAGPYFFTISIPFWLYEDLVSPGADDNASGVSVIMEAARVASESPPRGTELKFVAFGAEEQGLFGSKDFSSRTATPDFFLNLDSIGGGDRLSVIGGNGVFRKRETSSRLNSKLENEQGLSRAWAPFSGHDHIPFIKKGIEATTISSLETRFDRTGLDKFIEKLVGVAEVRTRRHSNLHTLEDVPEEIRLENIKKAGDIVLSLIGVEQE